MNNYQVKEYTMPRGYSIVGLHNPKQWNNVGQVLRAATNFDVQSVFIEGMRYQRSATDTTEYWKHKPLINVHRLIDIVPKDCSIVAVDLLDDAEPIFNFEHPERAFYIFGAEDNSIPEEIVEKAQYRIYIPTRHCLNLAMAVHTVLYDRSFKRKEYHQFMQPGKDAVHQFRKDAVAKCDVKYRFVDTSMEV